MSSYIFAPAADGDLIEIYLYTAEKWGRDQADLYTGRIVDTCRRIASGDVRGRLIPGFAGKYLKATIGSHFIVYRQDAGIVIVVRILHQRMDIASHIED